MKRPSESDKLEQFSHIAGTGHISSEDGHLKRDLAIRTAIHIKIGDKLKRAEPLNQEELDFLGLKPETAELYREFLSEIAGELNKDPNQLVKDYVSKRLGELKESNKKAGEEKALASRKAESVNEAREKAAAIEALLPRIREFASIIKNHEDLHRDNSKFFQTLAKALKISSEEISVRTWVSSSNYLTGQGLKLEKFVKLARLKLTTGEADIANVEQVLTEQMAKVQSINRTRQELDGNI